MISGVIDTGPFLIMGISMHSSEHYLSTLEAGRYLGVNKSTVRRRAARGAIPCTMIDGRRYFTKEDLDTFRRQPKKQKKVSVRKEPVREEKQPAFTATKRNPVVFFKWFTVTTGLLAMVFLFLSTLPYKDKSQTVLGIAYEEPKYPTLPARATFQEVVMAAATDSAAAEIPSLTFFGTNMDAVKELNLSTQGAGKKSKMLPASSYYEGADSYLAGYHGEAGPVAVIGRTDFLSVYPFFTNAHEGDKLLIYQDEKKALLLRPLTNEIIAFGALEDIPESVYQKEEKHVVMVHNRSGNSYDRTMLETEIEKVYPGTLVVTGDSVAHADHTKTAVVAVNGGGKAVAEDLARKLRAVVSTLPSDEIQPPAGVDILILIGKDRK